MIDTSRRSFLRQTTLATLAASGVTAIGLEGLAARATLAASDLSRNINTRGSGGYGSLSPRASDNTGETFLALPEGFRYTVFGRTGTPMSDGTPTPPAPDGMAAFAVGNELRLVRNHEVRAQAGIVSAMGALPYDPLAGGGTTTLIINPATRLPVREFVSLGGTFINCAGGTTPWNTWITCEETTAGMIPSPDTQGGGFTKPHGYCFEVDAAANAPEAAVPLTAMGRFVHEAIALDPETGIVYLTEDRGTAGLYRFIPNMPLGGKGSFAQGGRLQMLAIAGQPNYDTRRNQRQPRRFTARFRGFDRRKAHTNGEPLPVTWVDIDEPNTPQAETDTLAVYKQGFAKGGATFARLEGAFYDRGSVFINSTSGGDNGTGQVWQLILPRAGVTTRSPDGDLFLLFESLGENVLDAPDNLCVSPRGGLVLCEDGSGDQYLRGLTRQGFIFDFARNLFGFNPETGMTPANSSEFCGATFSPDGQTLFVNSQVPGLTYAIWGPWETGAL